MSIFKNDPFSQDYSEESKAEEQPEAVEDIVQEEVQEQPVEQQEQEEVTQEVQPEVQEEEVQEVVQEQVVEEVVQEVQQQEEITEDNITQPEAVIPEPSLTEDTVMKFLSEKLGSEITSLEGLKPKEVELDPDIKEIMEWKERTGRPIEDWAKFQKDYTKLGDVEVAREYLQYKHPELDSQELEVELSDYLENEFDDEDSSIKRRIKLKKLVSEGRRELGTLVSKLDTPAENYGKLSPEVQADLDFAQQVRDQQVLNQQNSDKYNLGMEQASFANESLKVTLGEGLSLDYKVSESERKSLPTEIATMPHWRNEDGSFNYDNIVQDGIKVRYFDKIVKMAFDQGISKGKEDLSKTANNITLGDTNHNSQQGSGKGGAKVEGLENFLGGNKLTFKRR